MSRAAIVLGFLAALALPPPAFAERQVIVGNQPIGPGLGLGKEVLAAVNVEERVYMYEHEGNPFFFFRGGPKAVNEAIRRFAAIPADKREIILLPGPARPIGHDRDNKPVTYDWALHVPMGKYRFHMGSELDDDRATLTIYIPEPRPPAPADAAKARAWIADLGRDDFKTRERAAKELTDLGPGVVPLLREALAGRASPEARDRMEKIVAAVSTAIRVDSLDIPAGVSVIGLDDILARCRKEMANKDPARRGHAAGFLAEAGAPADEVLPDLEKMLKTGTQPSEVAGAAWAAGRLGAAGRPLLPILRAAAKSADKGVASTCEQSIGVIEKAKPEPIAEEDAKRRAAIRKEIREVVEGRKKTGR
jgi:hypothetical protein